MVLEATMIIVDNSESSRNGDYLPTRFQAQADAINLIHSAKTQANPQSAVGLMSMGGTGPEVLVTLTDDIGKILDGLHRTKIHGTSHLSSSLQVAQLALKHRKEQAQRKRIVVFTCSAIAEDEKSLVKLARKLKKHNISVDIVAFGDLDSEHTKKLQAFIENVSGSDGSHLEIIPPGPNLLSDSLVGTPIIGGEAGGMSGGVDETGEGGGVNGFEFGIDPAADPELAYALRMSLEEEQKRLEKERKEKEEREGKTELEGIGEESGQASQQLQSGGSGGEKAESSQANEEKKGGDGDKMDTA